MKHKIININKDIIKRKNFLKKEIKKLTLMSIIQNLNINPVIRALALRKLSSLSTKCSISRQRNNVCLKTGRMKGTLRLFDLSRHQIKKLGLYGGLQNVKIKSW